MGTDDARIERFIARWQGREGGQERANYVLFLNEMCDAQGLAPPEPASAMTEENDYVFERAVKDYLQDGAVAVTSLLAAADAPLVASVTAARF